MTYGQNRMYYRYWEKHRANTVSQKKFTEICSDFNKEIMRSVLEDGFKFFVPYGIGIIRAVRTNKVKLAEDKLRPDGSIFFRKKSINWLETLKVGSHVYYENEHTNGYQYQIAWFRSLKPFKYKSLYTFKACKAARLKLEKILKDPNRTLDYVNDLTGSETEKYKKTSIKIRMKNGL